MSEKHRAWWTEKRREEQRRRLLAQKQDPEFREREQAGRRSISKRKASSENMKALHQDPEFARRRDARMQRMHRLSSLMLGKHPTWPEARFYGLVFGSPITRNGFSAQRHDGHGVYDGAWLAQGIVAELDGGGHHAFRDRRADDRKKDILRAFDISYIALTLEGPAPTILRETDESVLFLKALAILGEEVPDGRQH